MIPYEKENENFGELQINIFFLFREHAFSIMFYPVLFLPPFFFFSFLVLVFRCSMCLYICVRVHNPLCVCVCVYACACNGQRLILDVFFSTIF